MSQKQLLTGGINPGGPYVPVLYSLENWNSNDEMAQVVPSTLGFTDTFTLTCWVKLASTSGTTSFLTVKDASGTRNNLIELNDYDDTWLYVNIYDGAGVRTQARFYGDYIDNLKDFWVHAALVWDGQIGGCLVYKNGVLQDHNAGWADLIGTGMTDDNDRVIQVGSTYGGAPSFDPQKLNGLLYSAAFYNVALPQESVIELFNDGDGTTFDQLSNYGNYTQAGNIRSLYIPGRGTMAGNFGIDLAGNRNVYGADWDASDLSVDVPDTVTTADRTSMITDDTNYLQSTATTLETGSAFTVAWWLRRSVAGQAGTATAWHLGDGTTPNRITWTQTTDNWISLDFRNHLGQVSVQWIIRDMNTAGPSCLWEHFSLTYDSGSWLLYLNKVNLTPVVTPQTGIGDPYIQKLTDDDPTPTDTSRNITIGSSVDGASGGTPWAGEFYQFALWDIAISTSNKRGIYNNGQPRNVDLTANFTDTQGYDGNYTASANLMHLYQFDDAGDRGKDLGNAGTLKDLDTEAVSAGLTYSDEAYSGYDGALGAPFVP